MSQFKATHLQAPSFAYGLTERKWHSQHRFKLEKMDLSSIQHVFNAVRCAPIDVTRRVLRVTSGCCCEQAEPIDADLMASFLRTFGAAGFSPRAMSPGYGLAEHTVFVCDKGRQVLIVDKVGAVPCMRFGIPL